MDTRGDAAPSTDWLDDLGAALGRPLVVHLVGNRVIGDSRVIKSAQASMQADLPALVLGMAPGTWDFGLIEDVPVLRVRPVAAFGSAIRHDLAHDQAELDWWSARVALERPAAPQATSPRWPRRRRPAEDPSRWRAALTPSPPEPIAPRTGKQWWYRVPALVDQERAFSYVLERLRPDLIHVHDSSPLPTAVHVAQVLNRMGHRTRVLYDAHEWVPGLVEENRKRFRPYEKIEARYLRHADDVITVSPEMAELIRAHYSLPQAPGVVTNAPPAVARRSDDGPSVRAAIGLADDVPLMVYSGYIAAERGVALAIEALTRIEDLHLVLVVGRRIPALLVLLAQARALGVEDRVHLAGYVSPADVPVYLSSADVGVIPRDDIPNHNVSLPTKFREYLHARLPLVTSDNEVMKREIAEHGVGEVFPAGDLDGLVAALTTVLAAKDEYRARITDDYLHELSWESQAPILAERQLRLVADVPRQGPDATLAARLIGDPHPDTGPTRATSLKRLAIGPANYAGQATQWCRAVERTLDVAATSFAPVSRFDFAVDHPVPSSRTIDFTAMGRQLTWLLSQHTHVLIDGYRPVLGGLVGEDLLAEVPILQRHGITVGLIAHGSEIRDPDAHLARFPQSYFRQASEEWVDTFREITSRNRAIAAEAGVPTFVSTPDLLLDLPQATWLPLTVDIAGWASEEPISTTGTLRVLHAPSRSEPPVKGSAIIDPILTGLHERGAIEYVRVVGATNAEMRDLVQGADVVVDQILTGSYGVAAVEAMAAGRLVVGFVSDDVRGSMPEAPPIIDTPDGGFAAVIQDILDDRPAYAARAAQGPGFARRWHDGTAAANALRPFLGSS
jgi:glycosyltransferase involved in cell wall biosynthesis